MPEQKTVPTQRVSVLRGVGPKTETLLQRMGIETLADLFAHISGTHGNRRAQRGRCRHAGGRLCGAGPGTGATQRTRYAALYRHI